MAVTAIRTPPDGQRLVEPTAGYAGTRPWINFWRLLARVLDNLRQVSAISTVDVLAPAAITVNPVTSADADATYSANEVTLINELKSDVNTLTGQVDALRTTVGNLVTLTNQLKAAHNSQVSAISEG
jgi:hypothetical protein